MNKRTQQKNIQRFISVSICLILITTVCSSMAAALDWTNFQRTPDLTGYTTENGPSTNFILWEEDLLLPGSGGTTFTGTSNSPAFVNNKLYIGGYGAFFCFDTDGNELWNFSVGTGWIQSSAAVVNGKVFFAHFTTLYCLDAETGALLNSVPTDWSSTNDFIVAIGNRFYFAPSSTVYCYSADEMLTEIWSYDLPTVYGNAGVAVANDKLYVPGSAWLFCLDAVGNVDGTTNLLWSYETGGTIYSAPTIFDGKVYLGSNDDKLYCFDADVGGTPLWTYNVGADVESSPAIAHGNVYIGADNNKIYSIDAVTGVKNREAAIHTGWYSFSASPVVAGDRVYSGRDQGIYCYNALNGRLIFSEQYVVQGSIRGAPVVDNGKLYVNSNKLYCFRDNHAPDVPVISGPTGGSAEVTYTFTATTTDPENDDLYYRFDFADSTTTAWLGPYPSGTPVQVDHSWSYPGPYGVKVKSKDIWEWESAWSSPYEITIVPSPPSMPDGPVIGHVNTMLSFSVENDLVNTPNGDVIYRFLFDFGDGNDTFWIPEEGTDPGDIITVSHSYAYDGDYQVRVKAKTQDGTTTDWSEPLSLTIMDLTIGMQGGSQVTAGITNTGRDLVHFDWTLTIEPRSFMGYGLFSGMVLRGGQSTSSQGYNMPDNITLTPMQSTEAMCSAFGFGPVTVSLEITSDDEPVITRTTTGFLLGSLIMGV